MIGYVRKQLRMIRYYSAPRRRTLLTWFIDTALIAAILLAFPAAWLIDVAVVNEAVLIERDGHLSRTGDGGITARVLDPDLPVAPRDDIPYGEFHLKLVERQRGWPGTSTVIQPHVEMDLNVYDQPGSQRDVILDPGDPEYPAIFDALRRARREEMARNHPDPRDAQRIADTYDALLERWDRGGSRVDRHPLAWLLNTAASWAILSLALSIVAAGLWIVALLALHSRENIREERRREGRCAACGYDLFGLDFNERCPECGTIIR